MPWAQKSKKALPCDLTINPQLEAVMHSKDQERAPELVFTKHRTIEVFICDENAASDTPDLVVKVPFQPGMTYDDLLLAVTARVKKFKRNNLTKKKHAFVKEFFADGRTQWSIDDHGAGVFVYLEIPKRVTLTGSRPSE